MPIGILRQEKILLGIIFVQKNFSRLSAGTKKAPGWGGTKEGEMKILILPLKKYATSEEKRQYAEEVASAKRHYNSLGIECVEFVEPDPISEDELVKTLWRRGHLLVAAAECDGAVLALNNSVEITEAKIIYPVYTGKNNLVIRKEIRNPFSY